MTFFKLPDRFVPHEGERPQEVINTIAECARAIGAGALFVSWRHDPHCDHEASCRIARQAQVRIGGLRLFEYIVWGHKLPPSTEVTPIHGGFRIRIDDDALERKPRAFAAQRSQTTDLIHDDPLGLLFAKIDRALFDRRHEVFLESEP